MSSLTRLRLDAGEKRPLQGAHLAVDLRGRRPADSPYVYAGYVASLDGRIGLKGRSGPPPAIANHRDWRLFNELTMQADVILSSGRYVRDVASGDAQRLLPEPGGPFQDLIDWRQESGLPRLPAVAILSRSADFDPDAAGGLSDDVLVLAGNDVPDARARELGDAGVGVVVPREGAGVERGDGATPRVAGIQARGGRDPEGDRVSGAGAIDALAARGHRIICCASGPAVLHTIVERLDALFLTVATRLVGGREFSTVLEGPVLDPAPSFRVAAILFDGEAPGDANQLFLELERVRPRTDD